jgi:arabinan endo-1,5-alpha-L-arabinosidase
MRKTASLFVCGVMATVYLAGVAAHAFAGREPELLQLTDDLSVHDPVIVKEDDTYYIYCTGGGRGGQGVIPIRTSKDLHNWTMAGYVLDKLPDWVATEVPKARGAWAPDISFFNGEYHIYYAVSSFGVNDSAIGLVTNQTLDPKSPKYKWVDRGMIVKSTAGKDDFNAIDPNIAIEDQDHVWLNWGSFWGGIKMRRIDSQTGKLAAEDTTLYTLCSRPRSDPHVTPPVKGAVEAPFLFKHDDYWYLFVSYDFCCRGAASDYYVVVGRSKKITGPFLDKEGKSLLDGAGTAVVPATTAAWHGAGHEAAFRDGDTDYLIFHAYDANTGRPSLQISTMLWEDGWPRVAHP